MSDQSKSGSPEGITILIAEDSPTQAQHLSAILEQNDFTVIAARNGRAALALAREKMPAIIISDVMMPEMDGYELCRAIKSDPVLKRTPVVLVTELSSPSDVFKGLDAGADNFLVKPYEESALVLRIGYLVANLELRKSTGVQSGIEIELSGQRHFITAERQQILDLLISTYHQATVLYDRLETRQKELSRSYETLNALYGFADGLNRCRSEAEVASIAIKRGVQMPGVRAGWMYLRDAGTFRYVGPERAAPAIQEACSNCTCQRMLADGELAAAVNVPRCERIADRVDPHASVPLTTDGTPVGILNLIGGGDARQAFSEDELRTFTSIGNQISVALERARLHEALERKVEERTKALQAEVVERRQAEDAARRAEERLLDAIECLGDGFALFDAHGRLQIFNNRYREMHASIADRIRVGESFEELARAEFANGANGEGVPDDKQLAALIAHHREADGKPLVQRRGNTWLMSSERRTREGGTVIVQTDITELKKADQAKDEFVAMVSHELRTPLTSIRAALSMLDASKMGKLPQGADKLVQIAHRNCGSLIHLVEDLLDVAQISTGSLNLNLQLTDLQPILQRAVESTSAYSSSVDVEIVVTNTAKGEMIDADPFRISQVLSNLLSNAVKFSPRGSKVDLTVESRDGMIRMLVVDRGSGIPKAFQSHVFEAFAQADSSSAREKGGTGLGLRIAKTIVEAHHGRIGFQSEEGRGTTFHVELPLASSARTAATREVA